jgi:hypothetical protein
VLKIEPTTAMPIAEPISRLASLTADAMPLRSRGSEATTAFVAVALATPEAETRDEQRDEEHAVPGADVHQGQDRHAGGAWRHGLT